MGVALAMILPLGLLGQAADDPGGPAIRLEVMQAAAKSYEIRPLEGAGRPFRLQADPVLRFTNTVGATRDGAIFLWLDAADRPAVAAQIFVKRDGNWTHELTSLATTTIVGKAADAPAWTPTEPGLRMQPVPDAPKPAGSPEVRLRQMQAIARDFVAEDNFREQSWQHLRMLTKPFARFGKQDSGVIDGALFAYVLTTDPEVYLLLEAREGPFGPEWHYGFAPMTIYAVRASWKGRPVWELPSRWFAASKPTEAFYFHENAPPTGKRNP